jgi:hypothetical protein
MSQARCHEKSSLVQLMLCGSGSAAITLASFTNERRLCWPVHPRTVHSGCQVLVSSVYFCTNAATYSSTPRNC